MYKPVIHLTHLSSKDQERKRNEFLEQFSLLSERKDAAEINVEMEVLTEAVFVGGRERLQPIINGFQKVKETLEELIKKEGNRFNPRAFYRNTVFRDLEAQIINVLGFRDVYIEPWKEYYNKSTDDFSSKMLNCFTYLPGEQRFPIEALVTDKGFYDANHTLRCQIIFTLGIVRVCSAEELTAIFIHEVGHNIDPALVDIRYTETNVFSKYLTDREGAITPSEKNTLQKKRGFSADFIFLIIMAAFFGIVAIVEFIRKLIFKPEKALEKIREMIRKDPDVFTRQQNIEAFADNFARMYGLAGPLMNGLAQIWKDTDTTYIGRIKKEKARQIAIADITKMLIQDVHKTDLHRIHNLLKEYKTDLADPNIPPAVKKQIQADMAELETVVDWYLNKRSDFQNRVNQVIHEELQKLDTAPTDTEIKDAAVKEGVEIEFFDEHYTESLEAFEEKKKYVHQLKQRMDEKYPLERGDLARIKEKFGPSSACSWAKDKKGYFCYTHRCRSKSHPTIDGFPQKDVDFVRSTA